MTAHISAVDLAARLGQPHPPTAEQVAVVEAPLQPVLVVAGAGSGKTETMAARVVYLVANGLVRPEEILGLTFTRKAARQLSHRIRQRLAKLGAADAGEPTVLTYHAFGGQLLREFGPLVGIEPAARVLTPTSSWQLASSVVRRWDADLDTDLAPDLVTERLLQLAGVLADHLVTPAELARVTSELAHAIEQAPRSPRQREAIHSGLTALYSRLTNRHGILPLVEAYTDAKRRAGVVDFGDQMYRAAQLAADHPRVGVALRDRFRVVLLDEYQDTGHAQRIILRELFGDLAVRKGARAGHPVTAVGDPCQSIYTWRGASASNLPRFTTDFPAGDGSSAARLSLLTSFRNPERVLAVANELSAPLRNAPVAVDRLRPRPDAIAGAIDYALLLTEADEDDWVADQVAAAWEAARAAGEAPPSTAVLVRRRAAIPQLAAALTARGLPVDVPGLAGLLSEPEIVEIVSVLRMLVDPEAGASAVRVLTGPRFRLGLGDLAALADRARVLTRAAPADRPADQVRLPRDVVADALARAIVEDIEAASLLDAIADPGEPSAYSPTGLARIRQLSDELAMLRRRLRLPLTDLLVDIERTIGLDVEVALAAGGTGGRGRANLDAFAEVVADFVSAGGGRAAPTGAGDVVAMRSLQVTDLLAFLDVAAVREEGLELGEVEQRPDAVQVLTVHAAKGLEWDVVALPRLTETVFPSATTTTWMSDDSFLPPSLRGDRDDLPSWSIDAASDQREIVNSAEEHRAAWSELHRIEERRLCYVALTRAQRSLILSGHRWSRRIMKPRKPSEFLVDIDAVCRSIGLAPAVWAAEPADPAGNPLADTELAAQWPVDPLAGRRAGYADAAHLVAVAAHFATGTAPRVETRGQPPGPAAAASPDPNGWRADVEALIAERRAPPQTGGSVPLPVALSVTGLVELFRDPAGFAAQIRRPMPRPPAPAARRGTAFHSWLEQHFGSAALLDIDELPGADDADALDDASLDALCAAFLASPWANRTPYATEVSFNTVISGQTVRGRLDAVFADPDGGWTVVDWKTGAVPPADVLAAQAVQLAVYRLAWAALNGADPANVRAVFHYVRSGETIAPDSLPDAQSLAALLDATSFPGRSAPDHSVRTATPTAPTRPPGRPPRSPRAVPGPTLSAGNGGHHMAPSSP
jgi:DNA helicase II / ATP-dependent DNA helicase PcrA